MIERIADIYDCRRADIVDIPDRVLDCRSAWAIYTLPLPDEATRTRV